MLNRLHLIKIACFSDENITKPIFMCVTYTIIHHMKIIIICIWMLFPNVSHAQTVNIPIPSLPTLDSGKFNIMTPKDRFKLVTFWASWCVYCRKEFPNLDKLSKAISVYGVDYNDNIYNARRFLALNGNPYTKVLFDNMGILGGSLGIRTLPTSLLLENNKEIAVYKGPISSETVQSIKNYVNSRR